MYAIYIITNTINAKQYVGMTSNLKVRWEQHRRTNGSAKYLHAAIKKYGLDNFVFTHIADAFDLQAAKDLERMFIAEKNTKTPNGYNLTGGGDGLFGYEFSEETRQKMREKRLGKKSAPETIEKMKKFLTGNKFMLGKKLSNETKEKIGAASKGRKHTEAAKEKMRLAAMQRKHSEETKQKISLSGKGRKHTEAAKEKISAASKDHAKNAEYINKIRAASLKMWDERRNEIMAKNMATRAINKARKELETT